MKKYIIGNWKMNLNVHESSLFVTKLSQTLPVRRNVETVICPGFLSLEPVSLQINHRQMKLGAQDCYWRDEGAFTGEVSASQPTAPRPTPAGAGPPAGSWRRSPAWTT